MEPKHKMHTKSRSKRYKIVWKMDERSRSYRYSKMLRKFVRRNTNFVQHVTSDVVLRSGDIVKVIMDDDSCWMGRYNGRAIICVRRPREFVVRLFYKRRPRGSGAGQTVPVGGREPDNQPSNNKPVRIEVVERR